jgi:serine/threonine-protein kinase
VLYEMVTGVPLFKGDNAVSVAYQHVQETPALPRAINPDLPKNVEALILKAIQKSPDKRYQSADEFLAEVKKVRQGKELAAEVPESDKATQILPSVPPADLQIQETQTLLNPVAGEAKSGLTKNQKLGIIIGSAAAGLLIIGLLLYFLVFASQGKPEDTEIEVPNLSSAQTSVQACKMLQDVQLVCDLTNTSSDSVPEGMFISQDPLAGKNVKADSVVKVFFSTGANTAEIPDFEGKTEEETASILKDLGLELGNVKKEESGSIYENQVTRSEPPAHEKLNKGDKVNIWISTGKFKLPDLTGLTREEATASLAGINVQIIFEDVMSKLPEGTVVKQNPKPGAVPQGSSLTLGIAITDTRVTVPTIAGLDRNTAQNQLAELGLIVLVQPESSEDVGTDLATRTDPAAGTAVDKGSTVILYISSGPAAPVVPTETPVPPAP